MIAMSSVQLLMSCLCIRELVGYLFYCGYVDFLPACSVVKSMLKAANNGFVQNLVFYCDAGNAVCVSYNDFYLSK
jgi:hypothetical protein